MNPDPFVQQKRFVRDLQGPAASIFLILLISQQSLTRNELVDATNYSKDSITTGIRRLDEYGVLNYDGKSQGWSLALTRARQLEIFQHLLWQGHSGVLLEAETNECDASGVTAAPSQPLSGITSSRPDTSIRQKSLFPQLDESDEKAKVAFSPQIRSADQINQDQKDQIRSAADLAEAKIAPPDDEPLVSLLRQLEIREPAFSRFVNRQLDPNALLGWLWWGTTEKWIESPIRYAVRMLLNRQSPPQRFYDAARWWAELEPDGQEEMFTQIEDNKTNFYADKTNRVKHTATILHSLSETDQPAETFHILAQVGERDLTVLELSMPPLT